VPKKQPSGLAIKILAHIEQNIKTSSYAAGLVDGFQIKIKFMNS